MKPKGMNVAARAMAALNEGITYDQMDCQEFVEYCVRECGGELDSRGSNDMVRNHCAWLGTLENAMAEGKLVKGAGLLIWREENEKLPDKYRGDGFGDFYHVAFYVGEKALYDQDKNGKSRLCNAVHSSETMGRVAGTTTANGYTHVMLFDCIDYGMDTAGLGLGAAAESIINDEPDESVNDVDRTDAGKAAPLAAPVYVRVETANGGGVNIREKPQKGAITKYAAPVGTRMLLLGEKNGYYKVMYLGKARWVMKEFAVVEG